MFANKEIYDIVCTMQGLPKKNKIKEILSWGQKLLYIYTHIYIYIYHEICNIQKYKCSKIPWSINSA